jgi:hypothetical protein
MSIFSFRLTLWSWGDPPPDCESKHLRHGICVFGVEDIFKFESFPNIMLNKMLPEFDFGAIACWHERFFNKTYLNAKAKFIPNSEFYLNLPHVNF